MASILFPSGKNVLVELLDLAVDDVAPAVATANNYVSFFGQSSNFKTGQSRSSSKTPVYGASDIAVSGASSFNLSGDIYLGFLSGTVTQALVTAAGTGYTAASAVTVAGGTPTTPATAIAVINSAGGLSKLRVTNPGVGYVTAPTFTATIGAGATSTVTINQYTDAQLWPFRDADFITFRISPFGNTAASKKPYYYGTIAPTKFDVDFPQANIIKISLAGEGTGSLNRGEW